MRTNRREFLKGMVNIAAVLYAAPTIAAQLLDESIRPNNDRNPIGDTPATNEDWYIVGIDTAGPMSQDKNAYCVISGKNGEVIHLGGDPSFENLPNKMYFFGDLTRRPDQESPDA